MVRRTVFMLIALLALQFSWSVVAAYCTHESGRAAQHLGHHPDTNAADALLADAGGHADDSGADDQSASAHSHCASCAHGALSVDSLDGLAHRRISEPAPVSANRILTSYYTAPPERPQWAAAA